MSARSVSRILVVILGSLFVLGTGNGNLIAQTSLQVIATGLDNPRGLAFGPDGYLYVAEAGRGGTSPLCLPPADNPAGPLRCYGATGAVTRVTGLNVQQRIVTGLPSLAVASGEQATGPHDIAFGLGGDPAARAPFVAAGIRLGSLVRVLPNGQWDYVVDISAHEQATNPAAGTIDSNPYGLLLQSDRAVVADAGGNAVLQIALNGTISTLGVFPARQGGPNPVMQSVPTTVTAGQDGDLYVGELTGAPFPVGAARVYRVPRNGGTPVVIATGFTTIIDIAFGPNGVGYVLEHDSDGIIPPLGPALNGRLVRINADGTLTVLTTSLIKPGGVAIGPDGAVYVTNRTIFAGQGEVVRIVP
jgi:hypothetical protein